MAKEGTQMMITVRMAGGKKVTKEQGQIDFFTSPKDMPVISKDRIAINMNRVEYIRPAYSEELEHSKNHGY